MNAFSISTTMRVTVSSHHRKLGTKVGGRTSYGRSTHEGSLNPLGTVEDPDGCSMSPPESADDVSGLVLCGSDLMSVDRRISSKVRGGSSGRRWRTVRIL
jgi:hypothetical protein